MDPGRIVQVGDGVLRVEDHAQRGGAEGIHRVGSAVCDRRRARRAPGAARARWHDFLDSWSRSGSSSATATATAAPTRTRRQRPVPGPQPARYVGGMLEMPNARLYPSGTIWATRLRPATRRMSQAHAGAVFEELYAEPVQLEQFMPAMSGPRPELSGAGGKVRLQPLPDAERRRRRHGPARDARRPAPPAPAMHHLRPARSGADREALDCAAGSEIGSASAIWTSSQSRSPRPTS